MKQTPTKDYQKKLLMTFLLIMNSNKNGNLPMQASIFYTPGAAKISFKSIDKSLNILECTASSPL